jgi:mono/diheme cytochrome c family protein
MSIPWMRGGALVALALWLAPAAVAQQSRESSSGSKPDAADLDEDGQRTSLPPLPKGMTLDMIQQGDSLFRGKGGCISCHGPDGGGMPASGSGITSGLHFVPTEWNAIDSLIRVGIPEAVTRTPVAMPPRGAQTNLTDDESRRVAAYVWAISQVKGEPWPGGHRSHGAPTAAAPKADSATSPGTR